MTSTWVLQVTRLLFLVIVIELRGTVAFHSSQSPVWNAGQQRDESRTRLGVKSDQEASGVGNSTLQAVLVLGVDGTLYDDTCLIEQQIKSNCHVFSRQFGYSMDECEDMHKQYGSTIGGICLQGEPRTTVRDYYNDVYPDLDMRRLQKYSDAATESSGYAIVQDVLAQRALHGIAALGIPIVICSNSPMFHVKRVLNRIGLADLDVAAYVTPEQRGGLTKREEPFWDALLELYPADTFHMTLIDDNALNIETVETLGMSGITVSHDMPFSTAIAAFVGILPDRHSDTDTEAMRTRGDVDDLDASCDGREGGSGDHVHHVREHAVPVPVPVPDSTETFSFNASLYLEAKNVINHQSMNKDILRLLKRELRQASAHDSSVRVLDLGAGLFGALPRVLEAVATVDCNDDDNDDCNNDDDGNDGDAMPMTLDYIAVESNKELIPGCIMYALALGLTRILDDDGGGGGLCVDVLSFEGTVEVKGRRLKLHLRLVCTDTFSSGLDAVLDRYWGARRKIHLVVGCCFADLVAPRKLAARVVELVGDVVDSAALLWLPITFAASTRLEPPLSVPPLDGLEVGDSDMFECYHDYMRSMGRHPDPAAPTGLLEELKSHGWNLVAPPGSSSWVIDAQLQPYLWRCIARFVALGTVPRCLAAASGDSSLPEGAAALAWCQRLAQCSFKTAITSCDTPVWHIDNIDILSKIEGIQPYVPKQGFSSVESGAMLTKSGRVQRDALMSGPAQGLDEAETASVCGATDPATVQKMLASMEHRLKLLPPHIHTAPSALSKHQAAAPSPVTPEAASNTARPKPPPRRLVRRRTEWSSGGHADRYR
jgi:FMN phosphatase YigB (HAD superfamily)